MTAAVPDPRFRDQLAEAAGQKRWMWDELADDLMPTIAAEVEARVQAAANQRAAEVLDGVADELLGFGDTAPSKAQVHLAAWLQATADNLRAAALASPAPAQRAAEAEARVLPHVREWLGHLVLFAAEGKGEAWRTVEQQASDLRAALDAEAER